MAEEILEEIEEGENRGLFIMLIFMILLIVLIGGYMFLTSEEPGAVSTELSPTIEANVEKEPETSALLIGEHSIFASANSEENLVNAEMIVLGYPGFVVVHADDDGSPGEVIGNSSLLPSGESTFVEIPVDTIMQNGDIVYVMLHGDNGNEVYDNAEEDPPIINDQGDPIMMVVTVGDLVSEEVMR